MRSRFLALHFEITNKCNLRCKHCYNIKYLEDKTHELTTAEVKQIIDKAFQLGCEDIGFSGGEPFARSDILEIIEYVKNYPIHILSNGLLITEQQLDHINSLGDMLLEFRISLDGLHSHEMLRGVSYKKVVEKIKLLIEKGFIVTVNTMLTADSILELNDMYELFKQIGIDRWRIDFIFNSGNANTNHIDNDNLLCNFNEIRDLIIKYVNEKPDFEFDVNKMFRSTFLSSAKPIKYTLTTKPCAYQGALTIRPNGDVSFCPSMETTCGNFLTDNIEKITLSHNWNKIANISVGDLHEQCRKCKYLYFCGGGCRADSLYACGSLYEHSEFTCKLVEYYLEEIEPYIKEKLV